MAQSVARFWEEPEPDRRNGRAFARDWNDAQDAAELAAHQARLVGWFAAIAIDEVIALDNKRRQAAGGDVNRNTLITRLQAVAFNQTAQLQGGLFASRRPQ
jgi:hypothetical protein